MSEPTLKAQTPPVCSVFSHPLFATQYTFDDKGGVTKARHEHLTTVWDTFIDTTWEGTYTLQIKEGNVSAVDIQWIRATRVETGGVDPAEDDTGPRIENFDFLKETTSDLYRWGAAMETFPVNTQGEVVTFADE